MKKVFPVIFPLFLFFCSPALAQDPQLYEKFENWDVFITNATDGTFDICMATRNYSNEEMLIFYTDGYTFPMGFLLERWQLDARESYDISIQVDDGTPVKAKALAGEDKKSIFLELELSPYMMEFVRGSELFLNTAAGSLKFNLAGSGQALNRIASCALDNMPAEAP